MPVQQPEPPQLGIPYDFGAADNLEMTLNNAGGLLRKLLTYRANWANQYLTYQVSGPKQGWVGKEYSAWARQFNESQALLGKYVNQLCGRAVDVHNTSFNADRDGKRHLSYMNYAPSQAWRRAPVNTAPNNAEGATPQCLYNYADNATKANDDNFRLCFAKNLAAAAAAAPVADTAFSRAGNPPASALARAIAWFLRNQVLVLDARVRIVGEAFEYAGGRPVPRQPGFYQFSGQAQLEYSIGDHAKNKNSIDQRITDAQNLAKQVKKYGMTPDVWNRLRQHENDAVFTATFFNQVSPVQIETMDPHVTPDQNAVLAQAAATAFAGGLSVDAQKKIAQWIYQTQANSFRSAFYQDLAKNPQAAAVFLADFSQSHGYDLGHFISQGSPTPDRMPPSDVQLFANIIYEGTIGAENIDPDLAGQNITLLGDYYQANPGSHTYPRIDVVYGNIITSDWPDAQQSLADPFYAGSPDGTDVPPAAWKALLGESMMDPTTAARLLVFGDSQAKILAEGNPGNPLVLNSSGLIGEIFHFEANFAYQQQLASGQANAANWSSTLQDQTTKAANYVIGIIFNPQGALKSGVQNIVDDVIDTLIKHGLPQITSVGPKQPPDDTWQSQWLLATSLAYKADHNVGDSGKYATEFDAQPFLDGSGNLVANPTVAQQRAYSEWLKDPAVVQASINRFNQLDHGRLDGATGGD